MRHKERIDVKNIKEKEIVKVVSILSFRKL